MFPKSKFHRILKPAVNLFLGVFEPQGDIHQWQIVKPESRLIMELFEDLKNTTEANFEAFLKLAAHGDVNPAELAAAVTRFKMYYETVEKILVQLCENEPWYRYEIRRAMIKAAEKWADLKPQTVEEYFDKHGFPKDTL